MHLLVACNHWQLMCASITCFHNAYQTCYLSVCVALLLWAGGGMGIVCMDKVDCSAYASDVCTSTNYAQWATENCPVHCNKCGGQSGTFDWSFRYNCTMLLYIVLHDQTDEAVETCWHWYRSTMWETKYQIIELTSTRPRR